MSATPDVDLRGLLAFAQEIAWQAGRATLGHFQRRLAVDWKEDASPVTVADREAEQMLRRSIGERFPEHDVFGEEYGEDERKSSHRWIVDPIDGTRSFISGVPLYATLVGLEIEGDVAVGVANFPALGEMVAAAVGLGCWWNGRPARVSSVSRLEESLLVYTDAAELAEARPEAWRRLQAATRLQRGFGDAYGHCLVATGRAEIALDAIMKPWDNAALLPIVKEAGGVFSDWSGTPTIYGGNAVSAPPSLLDPVLELLEG